VAPWVPRALRQAPPRFGQADRSKGYGLVRFDDYSCSVLVRGGEVPRSWNACASNLESRHKLSYYEVMPMTSLNISLPEALKDYVEGQVASGDWGTPSEYVRELIRQDKERRLGNLEQELIAAAKGPKIELPIADIRKRGLIAVLRERTRLR
jgi:antitoxin ParD1/3/4